ncbi:MAG: hypothetical protein AB1894_15265 [Chloroflexota bacterium]
MPRKAKLSRLPILLLAMAALLLAMWAGLLRMGWEWPLLQPTLPLSHGPLMISGFFGTLISLERAVALGKRWAYIGPVLSGLGGILLIAGVQGLAGPVLLAAGSLCLVLVFAYILRSHRASYIVTMALGALSWFIGCLLILLGWPVYYIVMWWVGFLVLTIAGERLELGRMVRLSRNSKVLFGLAAGLFMAGCLVMLIWLEEGARLAGAGMLALAAWLLRYDIARRTVRMAGLTRYIAVCLLVGYFWLGISGVIGLAYGGVREGPIYDIMLHSVLLGFVFGMIFGHAPIIFPAILGIQVNYHPVFYTPLVFLNLSLILRLAGGLADWDGARLWGGLLNAITILLFLGLLVASRGFRQPAN